MGKSAFLCLDEDWEFRVWYEMRSSCSYIQIPLESPWSAPHAEEWDMMTVQQFCDEICWTEWVEAVAFASPNVDL